MPSKESQLTEFKLNWWDEYLKIICAFANTDGGKLISPYFI
jgi:ATP-dependent DNA helicase RecG